MQSSALVKPQCLWGDFLPYIDYIEAEGKVSN